MPIDVSVVVPVYNTGVHLEPCIESLLGQSLPPARLELIFVDDGSTDDTPQRLDRLAAEHAHVRVIHEPPSGWAGKPRNTGIDAARGDYVQFLDDDDTLPPRGLEHMLAMARRNHSDIVLGKMVGVRRGAPSQVYARDLDRATFLNAPLWTSFSVHKLFRRAFLDDHRLRFPEEAGRRLEDQYFMLQAYFAADVVSILGSRVCYYHHRRPDQGNLTAVIIDPPSYYGYLRDSLDLIDAQDLPDQVRDRILGRLYGHEMFRRLTEPRVLKLPEFHVRDLVDEVGKLLDERFPPAFDRRFGPMLRARAAAVRRRDVDGVYDIARNAIGVSAAATLDALDPRAPWLARVTVELVHEDGTPVLVEQDDDRCAIEERLLPRRLATPIDDPHGLCDVQVHASLRNRKTWVEWLPQSTVKARLERVGDGPGHRILAECVIEIDPRSVAGGRPLSRGSWDLWLRTHVLGLARDTRVAVGAVSLADTEVREISGGRLVAQPYATRGTGSLSIGVWSADGPAPAWHA